MNSSASWANKTSNSTGAVHNNDGHLVASVLVEDNEKYRHDDHGSEEYQSVA